MWLKFDEGNGDVAIDSTGNGHDGKLVDFKGNPWVDGKSGKALMFEGGAERVVVPYFDAMDTDIFTIEAWVYPAELPKGVIADATKITHIVDHEDSSNGWSLVIGDLGLEPIPIIWLYSGGWVNANGKTVLQENRWYNMAGVCDNGTLTIYLDGEEDATAEYATPWVRNTQDLVIGSYQQHPEERCMNGIIDDVRYSLVAKKKDELGFYHLSAISPKAKLATCWAILKAEY